MIDAVNNGKNQQWREYVADTIKCNGEDSDMEIEELNTGPPQEQQYKYCTTSFQQFVILLKRMLLQSTRDKVSCIVE